MTLILADGSEHPDKGKLVFMDRAVDATPPRCGLRAEFPNPASCFGPECSPGSAISLPTGDSNILVPERAVTELQGKNFVWVVSADNKATQRAVEVAPNRIGRKRRDSGRA